MLKLIRSLFNSPEKLLQVMSQDDVQDSIEDGDRIVIDENGAAMVNIHSREVQNDFARHVNALKRA